MYDFTFDVMFDLEATCWADSSSRHRVSEIIEIGAVLYDFDGYVEDKFQAFIKPVLHPRLSPFAKKLTTITQGQIEDARPFHDVFRDFLNFVEGYGDGFRLWSWGDYDRKQLQQDCMLHGIDGSFLDYVHYNLKPAFSRRLGVKRKYGVETAMEYLDMPFEGTAHRGIDDAINVGLIFSEHRDWYIENALPFAVF